MGELNQYMTAMVNELPIAALGGAAMMEYVAYLQGLCKRIDGLLQHSKALTHAAERSITEIEAIFESN